MACLGLSVFLYMPSEPAEQVQIWSEGEMIAQLDLNQDREITVESIRGINVVTIQNGAVAVTEADCPDGYCMARGYCHSGAQIVCLPNRLVLEFTGEQTIDGLTG